MKTVMAHRVKQLVVVLAALAFFLMLGCALKKSDIDKAVAYTDSQITGELSTSKQAVPAVVVHPGKWLAGREIALDHPSAPEITQRVRLASATPAPLREIAQRITQVTHIPVSLEPDLAVSSNGQASVAPRRSTPVTLPNLPLPGNGSRPQLPDLPIPGADGLPVPADMVAAGEGDGDPHALRIAYSHDGPLDGLLDQLAARFGVAWEYKGGRVVISRYVTRTFTLYLPPGTRTVEAEVGGKALTEDLTRGSISTGGTTGGISLSSGAGGSAQNNVGQTVKVETKLDPWKEIEEAVKRLLTPAGKVAASPSSGDIAVTDTPAAVKRVADYVEQKNASLVRQIAIQVEVLSVEGTDSEQFEIQWNLLFKNDTLGMMLVTPDLITGVTANLAMQILRPSSDFNGTKMIIKALSNALHGRVIQSTVATTLNNTPAPIQVTQTNGYLKATSTTVTGVTGVVSNTLVPGSITTGFQMTVTPRILDRDRVMLSYNIDLSRLLSFTNASVGSGDNQATIQIPNFERRAFIQAVAVKAGDTLVLSGFEQSADQSNLSAPVVPENSLFGSRQLTKDRTRIVILITPVLVGNGSV